MEEIWKDIEGYEGLYQVSNFGRIKSLFKNRIMSLKSCYGGYIGVTLYKDKKRKFKRVHKIVLETFIGKSNLTGNHKNGIKMDNYIDNLEYCTQSENNIHAYKTGLRKKKPENEYVDRLKFIKEHYNVDRTYWIKLRKALEINNLIPDTTFRRIRSGNYVSRPTGNG